MKKRSRTMLVALPLLLLSILYSCADEPSPYEPKNHLKQFSTVETQTFSLDTVEFKLITGKSGTKIYFNRDDFDVAKTDSIVLKLKEYYSFEDLLFNNIQTITNKNELLETSGVIKVNFYVNDQEVQVKEGRSVQIEFPDNRLQGNNVFIGTKDSLGSFSWTLEEQTDTLIKVNKGTKWQPVYITIQVDKDSVQNIDQGVLGHDKLPMEYNNIAFFASLNWINIGKVVVPDAKISFELESKIKEIDDFSFFVIYEDLNSLLTLYRHPKDLLFKNIPIRGNTYMLILGHSKEKYYSDQILLNDLDSTPSKQMNLKETTLTSFKEKLSR